MADVEVGLMAFFDDLGLTVTSTPPNLNQVLADNGAVLRIERIAGGGDRDNDYPTVSIQCFVAEVYDNPRAAHDLADVVWGRFLEVLNGDRPGFASAGLAEPFCFEDPSKTSGPSRRIYPDPAIAVAESIFKLTVRN